MDFGGGGRVGAPGGAPCPLGGTADGAGVPCEAWDLLVADTVGEKESNQGFLVVCRNPEHGLSFKWSVKGPRKRGAGWE